MAQKKEKTWEYHCNLVFNNYLITNFTITDYFQKHLKHGITKDIICQLVIRLPKEMKPRKRNDKRDIYVWERAPYAGRKYRLVFWFKDNTNNHLWIRNCHPQD